MVYCNLPRPSSHEVAIKLVQVRAIESGEDGSDGNEQSPVGSMNVIRRFLRCRRMDSRATNFRR